jgi:hypothetical protein
VCVIPAAAPLLTEIGRRPNGGVPSICFFDYLVLCGLVTGVTSERLTAYGVQTLARLRVAPDPPGRVSEAALGRDTAILAPFTTPGAHRAWSGHGEDWRLVTVGNPAPRVWPGLTRRAAGALYVITLPGAVVLTIITTLAGLGFKTGLLAALALDVVVFIAATAPWLRLPVRAEFEGQVLRQWDISGDDDEKPWSFCVAIDDGTNPQAWALTVTGHDPATLTPGTVVHVTVNPRLNKVRAINPVRPAVSAHHLLNPTPDPRTGGLG